MDIGSILIILALLIVVVGFIARPILEKRGVSVTDSSRKISALQADRDQVLMVLQELDMDHTMGKILTEDYDAQRPSLVARGARILRELDQLGALTATTIKSNGHEDQDMDAVIEAEIMRRRKTPTDKSAGFCSQCGNALQVGDRFCTSCGAKVELVEKEA
jgi:hypothetical protein